MRDMFLIGGFAIFVVGLVLVLLSSVLTTHISRNFWVNSYSTFTLSYHLNSGDKMECRVTVLGGDNYIKIYIRDPLGVYIPCPGPVRGEEDFSYTADVSGVYVLCFDNSFSGYSKQVFFSMDVIPALAGSPLPWMLIFMGLIIVAVRYWSYK